MRSSVFCWLAPFVRMPNAPAVPLYVESSRSSIRRGGNPAEKLNLCCRQLLLLTYHHRRQTKVTEADELLSGPSSRESRPGQARLGQARPFQRNMSNGCALKHSTVCLAVSSLPPSTTLSHTVASQSLVMSPGGVANDNSVTLTLADAQGMLDGVTLNLNTPVKTETPMPCFRLGS